MTWWEFWHHPMLSLGNVAFVAVCLWALRVWDRYSAARLEAIRRYEEGRNG